jgi:hypothetical protein
LLKKLLCRHSFEYYHKGKYTPYISAQFIKWHFICKSCGKTKTIYEHILDNEWKDIAMKIAKEKAMGIDHSEYENLKFVLGCFTYKGKGAYYMKQKYKQFIQEEVIPQYS